MVERVENSVLCRALEKTFLQLHEGQSRKKVVKGQSPISQKEKKPALKKGSCCLLPSQLHSRVIGFFCTQSPLSSLEKQVMALSVGLFL